VNIAIFLGNLLARSHQFEYSLYYIYGHSLSSVHVGKQVKTDFK